MKRYQKRKHMTKHHLVNKCEKGTDTPDNILRLYAEKHEVWHLLFGNRNLSGAIALLKRVQSIKQSIKPMETYHA